MKKKRFKIEDLITPCPLLYSFMPVNLFSAVQPRQGKQATYGYGLGVKLLHINQDLQKFTSFSRSERKGRRRKKRVLL